MKSFNDFAAERVDGLFVFPTPLGGLPSPHELALLDQGVDSQCVHPETVAQMRSYPVAPVPATPGQWVDVATQARQTRTLAHPNTGTKVLIGGRVFHTHLERKHCTTRQVHQFDRTPDELRAAVWGTLHPLGQATACPCGSDQRFIDCCAARLLDEGCSCGSGTRLRNCCYIGPRVGAAALSSATATV